MRSQAASFFLYTAEVGICTGLYAAAGAVLGKPIGAAGGAVFGVCTSALNRPVNYVVSKLLKPTTPVEKSICNIVAFVVSTALGYCLASFAFSKMGIPFTVAKIGVLQLTAFGLGAAAVASVALAVCAVGLVVFAVAVVVVSTNSGARESFREHSSAFSAEMRRREAMGG